MHQTRVVATLPEHARNNIFLADMRLGDVLDGNARLSGQRYRTVTHAVTQRLGKFRVVEDADAFGIQISGHPGGIAHHRQRPGDHQSVVARQHPGDPVVVAIRQRLAHVAPGDNPQGRLHQTYWFRLRRLRVSDGTFPDLMVPRCLGWTETCSRGRPHVELALHRGQHITAAQGSKASGPVAHRLIRMTGHRTPSRNRPP